jgi:hypothetical protein
MNFFVLNDFDFLHNIGTFFSMEGSFIDFTFVHMSFLIFEWHNNVQK